MDHIKWPVSVFLIIEIKRTNVAPGRQQVPASGLVCLSGQFGVGLCGNESTAPQTAVSWSDLYRHLITLIYQLAAKGFAADDLYELKAPLTNFMLPHIRPGKELLLLLVVGIDQADQRASCMPLLGRRGRAGIGMTIAWRIPSARRAAGEYAASSPNVSYLFFGDVFSS
jgi:hypothetical protein